MNLDYILDMSFDITKIVGLRGAARYRNMIILIYVDYVGSFGVRREI